jgi:SAM-dependent methyltransferase
VAPAGFSRRAARAPLRTIRRVGRTVRGSSGGTEPAGDVPLFDQPFYEDITGARLEHLASLDLPLAGRSVIDVGSGIGRLSEFFVARRCDVFCVDGREDNIAELRRLYPDRRAAVVDVQTEQLLEHGSFDVVFCYGLLYHLSNPFAFLQHAAGICRELMIVETCITDSEERVVFLVDDPDDPTMALNRVASRPSPAYVITALRLSGFPHVYSPRSLPRHKDFEYERRNDSSHLRDGNVMRDIFVASRRELSVPSLRPV